VKQSKSIGRRVVILAPLAALLSLGALVGGFSTVRSSSETERLFTPPPSKSSKPKPRDTSRPLAFAASSEEELARNVIAAIEAGDQKSLEAARITEGEFRDYVWPELPASKVPNVTAEFAWSQANLKNYSGMGRVLDRNRGQHYEFVSMRYLGGDTVYPTYTVHNKAIVTVRDHSGDVRELRLFGSVLELDGQYKLFSYVAD